MTVSDSDQLIKRSVTKALFGIMTSLRSKSVMVVARIRILLTVPEKVPMVTVSPIRTGRSKRIIKPETKLPKISCRPNPKPTDRAAASHCSLSHETPNEPNTVIAPITIMA